jgi:hypothetical protein
MPLMHNALMHSGLCRLAELHDRLASLALAADARSRFIRLMSACAEKRELSSPTFAAGLPGLSLGMHLPAPTATASRVSQQSDDMQLRAIGNMQHWTPDINTGIPSRHATQPRHGAENLAASQVRCYGRSCAEGSN